MSLEPLVDRQSRHEPALNPRMRAREPRATPHRSRGNAGWRWILSLVLLALAQVPEAWAGMKAGSNFSVATTSATETDPALAVNADTGQILAVWTAGTTAGAAEESYEVRGRLIDADNPAAGDSFSVSAGFQTDPTRGGTRPRAAFRPALGETPAIFIVVYQRNYPGSQQQGLFAQRLGVDGALLGSEITVVDAASNLGEVNNPDIAYDAKNDRFLIVWDSRLGVVSGRLLEADGTPIGSEPAFSTPAGRSAAHPSVAFNPQPDSGEYLLVYDDRSPISPTTAVFGLRLVPNTTGLQAGTPFLISGAADGNRSGPIVGLDTVSSRYLVAWSDARNIADAGLNVFGKVIETGGAVPGDDLQLASFALAPALAYSAAQKRFLLTWIVQRKGAATDGFLVGRLWQLDAADLAADGDPFPISDRNGATARPVLAVEPSGPRVVSVWPQAPAKGNPDVSGQILDLSFRVAELTLSVGDRPDPAKVGKALVYTVVIANPGTVPAKGVKLVDQLPPQTTLVGVTGTEAGTCTASEGPAVSCDLGIVAAGATITLKIKVTAAQPALASNTATLTWLNGITDAPSIALTTPTQLVYPGKLDVLPLEPSDLLPSGAAATIKWELTRPLSAAALKFRLFRSFDNGAHWTRFDEVHVAANAHDWTQPYSYPWTVPIPAGNKHQALVRVAGATDADPPVPIGTDLSDPFAIEVVHLDAPNGSETLVTGATATIQWTTHQTRRTVAKVRLQFSANGGESWKDIGSVTGNPGTYPWPIPILAANALDGRVRVILLDDRDRPLGRDGSDQGFAVSVIDLLSPNGGETLHFGDTHSVRWQTHATRRPVALVRLQYSTDAGTQWNNIVDLVGDPGTYDWVVPTLKKSTRKAAFRAVLKDQKGRIITTDVSDKAFTIRP